MRPLSDPEAPRSHIDKPGGTAGGENRLRNQGLQFGEIKPLHTDIKDKKIYIFSHAEAFYFDEVPFVYSFLYVPCFRGHVCEDAAAWNV